MAAILIVEDNQSLAETIKDILVSHGHYCEISFGIKSAKAFVENDMPDIVILDFYLPDGTAINLINYIRVEKKLNLPIIGISAAHDDVLKFKVLEAGANDHINKPFNAQELIFKVNNYAAMLGKPNKPNTDYEKINNSLFENLLIDEIESLIHNQKLSLPALAKRMKLSTSGLSKKIKRITGKSYFDIIAIVKITKAKKLLARGDHNISQVALLTGFKRVSHFSSFFKAMEGISPKKFELTNKKSK